jgi:acetolactate synthase-1/3 small subunit
MSVLVENHFGVLARVAGMFSSRGYNIDSLSVGVTEDPATSRMTVVVEGDEGVLEQIVKQLEKLVEVIQVDDLTSEDHVERELVMVSVDGGGKARSEIIEIATIFRARIVDMGADAIITEVTGTQDKVNAFIDMMRPFGITELVRTGRIAIQRTPKNGDNNGN